MDLCKMISLDTSSLASGWAYWENGILKEHDVIYSKKIKNKEDRLDYMCENLVYLLNHYNPNIIVIEMTSVARNAYTQRILTEIVGVVRGYSLVCNAEFVRYRVSEWRKLTKDEYVNKNMKSRDWKAWAVEKIRRDYGIDPKDDNEADAILIGQARINQFKKL